MDKEAVWSPIIFNRYGNMNGVLSQQIRTLEIHQFGGETCVVLKMVRMRRLTGFLRK